MGLQEFQRVLLQLYTDPALLHSFMHKPEETLAQFSLSDREKHAVLALPRERLRKWQYELQQKRRRVAERVARIPESIVLLSFLKNGPAIAWGPPPYVKYETITPGMYWLLHEIGKNTQPITLTSLMQAWQTAHTWSLRDVFQVAKFMYTHACIGKKIIVI